MTVLVWNKIEYKLKMRLNYFQKEKEDVMRRFWRIVHGII